MRFAFAFVFAALVATEAGAQAAPLALPHPKKMKGQAVVYRIPTPYPLPKDHDGPWVADSGGRVYLEGVPVDSILGFPSNQRCKVSRVTENKRVSLIGLYLDCDKGDQWLFVPIDSASAVRGTNAVLAPPEEAGAVIATAKERIRRLVFSGALASVPEQTQSMLLDAAREGEFSPFFAAREFQGKNYFRVNLGLYPSVMNTARLNMNQRISTALTSSILTYLKAFGVGLGDSGGLGGINLRVSIGHRNFVSPSPRYEMDLVEIYMQTEDIVRFSRAEITGQELVDRSVVLVNDNRTKLVLSDSQ